MQRGLAAVAWMVASATPPQWQVLTSVGCKCCEASACVTACLKVGVAEW
jgi:hypothetical protein